ncbi:methionine-R-sulfoxide reductase [Ceratobasidium sp. AG-Ba]|nr:methionine-R-sulfoxide reductase [Ceratobasidium sp. AG-Ba]
MSANAPAPVTRTEDEWRAQLSPEQFRILREKGTERAGTGKYDKHYEEGTYTCAGCGTPLYTSKTKFKSGCGWPAYYDAIPGAVTRHEDRSFGMLSRLTRFKGPKLHALHVVDTWVTSLKAKATPLQFIADERHCVNSVSLSFSPGDPVEQK